MFVATKQMLLELVSVWNSPESLCFHFMSDTDLTRSDMSSPGPNEPTTPHQAILDTIRGISDLSSDEKTALERMVQIQDSKLMTVISAASTGTTDLCTQLVALVRGTADMDTDLAVDTSTASALQEMKTAWTKIQSAKLPLIKSALRYMLKMVQNILTHPDQPKHRRLPCRNILTKKYILDLPGGLEFVGALGFHTTSDDHKSKDAAVVVDSVDLAVFEAAKGLMETKLADVEQRLKAPQVDKPRARCLGGCGFWGDDRTEGYCSSCFKHKYLGITSGKSTEEKKAAPTKGGCIKKCGNYGSQANGGMCNSCFRQHGTVAKAAKRRWRVATCAVHFAVKLRDSIRPKQIHKNRCWTCRRKIGILGIECRCGYVFCSQHRYPTNHECSFNYRKAHKEKLLRDNPAIQEEKFDRSEL